MFKSLGSVLCVVVMAAFVFGCGGGGGGGGTAQMPDMPPDEPTDAELIDDTQQEIATILSNAQTRASVASSAASSIRTNDDATAGQIANAASQSIAAQAALKLIEIANTAAKEATTPAAAKTALTNAETAQTNLNAAALAISSIQSTVQTVTNARMQLARDETAQTGGSSLIQHVRDNKLVFDAILADLKDSATDPLTVAAADTSNLAVYPKDEGPGAARVVGMRTVTVTPVSGTTLTSNSTTPTLRGTSTLPNGFDLDNATATTAATTFVNAYTDINKTKVVQTRTVLDSDLNTEGNQAGYENIDVTDTDYLLAGIWLQNNTIGAFAYGSQPITTEFGNNRFDEDGNINTTPGRCGATESDANSTPVKVCTTEASGADISDFVEDGRDVNATYRGQANGARLAAGETSYFTGDVNLTAKFVNPTSADGAGTDSNGSIEGAVTNIVAGGQPIEGSIELQKHTFNENGIGGRFEDEAVGVVEGKSYSGSWKGQFFGREFRRTPGLNADGKTEVKYESQAPGSVAGNFYVVKESTPKDEAFIGAFGANR